MIEADTLGRIFSIFFLSATKASFVRINPAIKRITICSVPFCTMEHISKYEVNGIIPPKKGAALETMHPLFLKNFIISMVPRIENKIAQILSIM